MPRGGRRARSPPPSHPQTPTPTQYTALSVSSYPTLAAQVKFDEVVLPGYVRSGSLPSQAWVIYNAKLTSSTGTGAYVLHSGGGLSERIYDMVGDAEGNVYNVGCTSTATRT